jgi:transcription initiation factor TFIID TATA-box-binding protein
VIQNIVASINLHTTIDLETVAQELPASISVKYIPDNFPGLVIKISEPKVTILIFSTGKGVITGVKEKKNLYKSLDILIEQLEAINIPIEAEPLVIIQNMVASGDFQESINLELAALTLDTSIYEPEVFPGLIYRMQDPKIVFLLFQSGKFVCTGFRRDVVAYEGAWKFSERFFE